MKKDTARALMIVFGVLVLLAILGLGSAAFLFTSAVDVGQADPASAAREFEEIHSRFAGVQPVLDLRDGEPVVLRRPPEDAPAVRLSLLRVLHWDPDDGRFTRVDVPFWFLRLKAGPIEIMSNGRALGDGELGLTVEELERLGATLVLHHEDEGGERLIVWTE